MWLYKSNEFLEYIRQKMLGNIFFSCHVRATCMASKGCQRSCQKAVQYWMSIKRSSASRILFHVDWSSKCCLSSKDRLTEIQTKNTDRYLQPLTADPFFSSQHKKKIKKTILFLLFAFICNVSLNMSKQIETQARHSQILYNHCPITYLAIPLSLFA